MRSHRDHGFTAGEKQTHFSQAEVDGISFFLVIDLLVIDFTVPGRRDRRKHEWDSGLDPVQRVAKRRDGSAACAATSVWVVLLTNHSAGCTPRPAAARTRLRLPTRSEPARLHTSAYNELSVLDPRAWVLGPGIANIMY